MGWIQVRFGRGDRCGSGGPQGIHQRQPGMAFWKTMNVLVAVDQPLESGKQSEIMFGEQIQREPRGQEPGDDRAHRMSPAVVHVVAGDGIRIRVGSRRVVTVGPSTIEVGIGHLQRVFTEDVGQGVELHQVEDSSRFQEVRDLSTPAFQVVYPAEGPEAGVDDVEGILEQGRGLQNVADHEFRLDPRLPGEIPGRIDCGGTEIQPGHQRTLSGPAEGVQADVALKMGESATDDITDLLELERAELGLAGEEAIDVVEIAFQMDRNPFIPGSEIRQAVFGFHGQGPENRFSRDGHPPRALVAVRHPIEEWYGRVRSDLRTVGPRPRMAVGALEIDMLGLGSIHMLIGALAVLGTSVIARASDCPADIDGSGGVDGSDLALILAGWGPCSDVCPADLDGDGMVAGGDLAGVLAAWGVDLKFDCDCDGSPGGCEGSETLLFDFDVEHRIPGPYDEQMLEEDWNDPPWCNGVEEGRVSVVDAGDGNTALQVAYPAGTYGTSANGAQWKVDLGGDHEQVRLRYRLRFGDDFDFVRGGKLPGLIGGQGNTGGGVPSGEDGWSARMMWRTAGAVEQYTYHPDQPENYGDSMPWIGANGIQVRFEPGRWHQVEHEIRMNTPGLQDGWIRCRFDGEVVLERTGMRFRDVDDFAIDRLYFSTFFGGSNSDWATSDDEVIWFDDFEITSVSSR